MEAQIADLTAKIQQVREQEARLRIDFTDEAESRERLIQLYKEEATNCKHKLSEAGEAIVELKQFVSDMKHEYENVCEEKARADAKYEATVRENDETIGKLEQELKNANELLSIAKRKGAAVLSESDIEQLSPAAAVASRLLKSGMSLTQIYSEYVNLSESLESERAESARLRAYIAELVREMEEKAPVLRRQKQEYEEAVKTVHQLTTQLENAMMDYEVLRSKSDESIKVSRSQRLICSFIKLIRIPQQHSTTSETCIFE
jgi:nucleoprotein TPR